MPARRASGHHLLAMKTSATSFTISPGEMFLRAPPWRSPPSCGEHWRRTGRDDPGILARVSGGLRGSPASFGSLAQLYGRGARQYDRPAGIQLSFPLKSTPKDTLHRQALQRLPSSELQEREENAYKYDLEGALPQINSKAGSAHTAKSQRSGPFCGDIAMYSIHITAPRECANFTGIRIRRRWATLPKGRDA